MEVSRLVCIDLWRRVLECGEGVGGGDVKKVWEVLFVVWIRGMVGRIL